MWGLGIGVPSPLTTVRIKHIFVHMLNKMFQYRIYPTKKQERRLCEALEECWWLYNHLLERRKVAYEQEGKNLSCFEQQRTYGMLKQERPRLHIVHSQVLQNVAVRIDLAFKAFFCRVREGAEESGYPRFKGKSRRIEEKALVKVNPAYTSQTCSACGHRQPMPLSLRIFDCPCCHVQLDRDLNAAKYICALGRQGLGLVPRSPAL